MPADSWAATPYPSDETEAFVPADGSAVRVLGINHAAGAVVLGALVVLVVIKRVFGELAR
jgi:hypothetical protein